MKQVENQARQQMLNAHTRPKGQEAGVLGAQTFRPVIGYWLE